MTKMQTNALRTAMEKATTSKLVDWLNSLKQDTTEALMLKSELNKRLQAHLARTKAANAAMFAAKK